MSYGGQTPTVVVLKEGTDTSQGRGQILSNIDACLAVQDTLKPTLGPFGSDVLLVSNGKTTITNDGATILHLLDVIDPPSSENFGGCVEISRCRSWRRHNVGYIVVGGVHEGGPAVCGGGDVVKCDYQGLQEGM